MKRITSILFVGVFILSTSCKKYLDINANPNQATSATPELILPLALTASASVMNSFNTYAAETGLYAANAGGYGGFGEAITYNYTTTGTGTWGVTYDNLEDYQAILNKSAGAPLYSYYTGVAKIMKSLEFGMLVDAYGDIPYTDALQGADNLTPSYTDAPTIYKSITDDLDSAIAYINIGDNTPGVIKLASSDVIFGGDVAKWKQLANTIKLRLILRAGGKVQFTNTTFSTDGFLISDALIDPGFTRDNGKQNPSWSTWAYNYDGTAGNKAWMPSQFIFGFYDGTTLKDPGRGSAIYYQFPNTGINRLGIESNSLVSSPTGSFWYSGTARDGKSNGDNVPGILKGPSAGQPVMLASESYFLQAEAAVRGIIQADAKNLFKQGIQESFRYLYSSSGGASLGNVTSLVSAYMADNVASPLVNFDLATSTEQKIEAIITQKFIALNFINSQEGWNEYRRTHFPSINPSGSGFDTFASTVSESTRADKLPTRILYPTSEGQYNSENVPSGISPFSSLIFWAKQ